MRNIPLPETNSEFCPGKKLSCPKRKCHLPTHLFSGVLLVVFRKYTLPETNSLHLKMDGWKTTFLLGPGLFSGAMLVSGRISKNIYSHTGFPGQVSFFSTAWMSQPLLFVNLTLHLKTLKNQQLSSWSKRMVRIPMFSNFQEISNRTH